MSTFTTVNPATVGEPTKKSDFDKVFENTMALSTFLGDRDLTDGGILLGSGTGAITPMAQATAGAIVVGQGTGNDPALRTLSGGISGVSSAGVVPYISQGNLKSTVGSVNSGTSASYVKRTLPGGEYGFYPQIKVVNFGTLADVHISATGAGVNTTVYVTNIDLKTSGGHNLYVRQRYITASGEVFWIFLLRDKITKKVYSGWQGPDHPCMGNSGKPLLVQHPFPGYDSDRCEIVVINPTKGELAEMRLKTVQQEGKADKDLLEVILEDYEIDEDSRPKWPDKEVTIGLPPKWDDAWHTGKAVEPIKKVIPKPDYILCRKLKLKNRK